MAIVVVRADASETIGTGHVMRCLSLVQTVVDQNDRVLFLCTDFPGNLASVIADAGYEVVFIQQESLSCVNTSIELLSELPAIDLLIVDHYQIDAVWESGMRSVAQSIVVIDDLANRDHDCDILIDHNLRENAEQSYLRRVPKKADLFLGPQYTPFRKEFYRPDLLRDRDGSLGRILVFPGGSDPTGESEKCIEAFSSLKELGIRMDLVVGLSNPRAEKLIASIGDSDEVTVHYPANNMAELISQADLMVGTCGIVSWERCSLGLPALTVITAENQLESARLLHKTGAVECLGYSEDVGSVRVLTALIELMHSPQRVRDMSQRALAVTVGWQQAGDSLKGHVRKCLGK